MSCPYRCSPVLIALLTWACDTTEPEICSADTVTVTVMATASPEFSWSPTCPIGQIEVRKPDGSDTRWLMYTLDDNRVLPPLVYGAHLDGMRSLTPAMALESGTTYVVRLGYLLHSTQSSQLYVHIGETSFTVP